MVWTQGPLNILHEDTKRGAPHTLELLKNRQRALSTFCILDQHGYWGVGKGYTKSIPSGPLLVSCLSPVLQVCRPSFFPRLNEAPSQLEVFACAVPSAWKTILLSLHTTTPYSSPEMPLPQRCLTLTPTISLPPTLPTVVCSPYHNCNLNIYCVITKEFFSPGHMYYWHWGHVLPCLCQSSPNASYSDWHMAHTYKIFMSKGRHVRHSWPVSHLVKMKNIKGIYWNNARQSGLASWCVVRIVTQTPTIKRAPCLV